MSFDGIPRPSQLQGYTDPLNPYLGVYRACEETQQKPRVQKTQASLTFDSEHPELGDENPKEKHPQEDLSEEERQRILLFAKVRGLLNFSLENGTPYGFHFNGESFRIDLVNLEDSQVILSLTPEDFLQVSKQVTRYAGMLANREA